MDALDFSDDEEPEKTEPERTPARSERTPARSERTPARSERTPARSERTPARSERTPARSERTRTWEEPPSTTASVGLKELADRWRMPSEEKEEEEEEEGGPAGPLFGRTATPVHKRADEAERAFRAADQKYAKGAKKIRDDATAILKASQSARKKIDGSVKNAEKALVGLQKKAQSKSGTVVDIKVHEAKLADLKRDSEGWLNALMGYEHWANDIIGAQDGNATTTTAAGKAGEPSGEIRQIARAVELGPGKETGTETNATGHQMALLADGGEIELAGRIPGGATYREKIPSGRVAIIAAGSQYNVKNRALRSTVLTFVHPEQ